MALFIALYLYQLVVCMKKGLMTWLALCVLGLVSVLGQDWEWKVKKCSYIINGLEYEMKVDKVVYEKNVLALQLSNGEIEEFEGEFKENIDGYFEMMCRKGNTIDYFLYQPKEAIMTRMYALKMNLSTGRYYLFELEK